MGNFLSSMSLKSGTYIRNAGIVTSNYVIGQMARRLGLPLRYGDLYRIKIEDAQAAYESADSMHSTNAGGIKLHPHAAGVVRSQASQQDLKTDR